VPLPATSSTLSCYRPLAPPDCPHLLHHPTHLAPPNARLLLAALAAPPPPSPHHCITSHHRTRPPPPESPLAPARSSIPNNLNPNLGAVASPRLPRHHAPTVGCSATSLSPSAAAALNSTPGMRDSCPPLSPLPPPSIRDLDNSRIQLGVAGSPNRVARCAEPFLFMFLFSE
jgi:hypothetical protein